MASAADRQEVRWQRETTTRSPEDRDRNREADRLDGPREPSLGLHANPRSALQPGARDRSEDALWPTRIADEARALQWTLWAANGLEPLLSTIAFQLNRVSEAERDHTAIEAAKESLLGPLDVLDNALKETANLISSEFCVADLNVASVLVSAATTGYDFSNYKNVTRWFQSALRRPAGRRATKMALG